MGINNRCQHRSNISPNRIQMMIEVLYLTCGVPAMICLYSGENTLRPLVPQ